MNSNSKPIFSLTVDEFIEALREGLASLTAVQQTRTPLHILRPFPCQQ